MIDRWATVESVKHAVGENNEEAAKEVRAELNAMIRELAGPEPSPIEQTLAETAALCWLAVRMAHVNAEATGLTFAQAGWRQRKLDHCHRRYLSMLKTLAMVRKLGIPAVQINVAEQQVNVAGAG